MSGRIVSTKNGRNEKALEIILEFPGERPIFDAYNKYIGFLNSRDEHS